MSNEIKTQFILLIQQFKDHKLEKVIGDIIESDLYLFHEFLDQENIQKLKSKGSKHYNTLNLFANETYGNYKTNPDKYIKLSNNSIKKLKAISILELGKTKKNITYKEIGKIIDVNDTFEIESILFDLISKGLIKGKIFGEEKYIEIFAVKPRGNLTESLNESEEKLNKIINNLNEGIIFIDKQKNNIEEFSKKEAHSYL